MDSLKEILISKEVAINIAYNSITSGNLNTSQMRTLHLLLERRVHNTANISKELVLQVTDELDPLLLLSAVITESGYHNLKSSQGLLVDFNSFPHHFAELIQRCLEDQKDTPKFILVLRTTGQELPSSSEVSVGVVTLEVVELNAFKHLSHLALQLNPASLQNKLSHLSSCIKMLKNTLTTEREKTKLETNSLNGEIRNCREKLSTNVSEMEALKIDTQNRVDAEVKKYTNMVKDEKALILKIRSDFDRKLEREKQALEKKLTEEIRELKSEKNSLKKKNSEFVAKNERLDGDLYETKRKLRDSDENWRLMSRDLDKVFKEKDEVIREAAKKDDIIQSLRSQIAKQEKSLKEMDMIIQNGSKQVAVLHRDNEMLVRRIDAYDLSRRETEEKYQNLLPDFEKGLEIIEKLKKKLKDKEKEITDLVETLNDQEKCLNDRNDELKNIKEERDSLSGRIESFEAELQELSRKFGEANGKIMEQERTLKSNENVISWMNKRLNEKESGVPQTKKTPAAERHSAPLEVRPRLCTSTPTAALQGAIASSTPLSNHSAGALHFPGSAQSRIQSLSNVIPLKISEEVDPENKENSNGLEEKYLLASKKQTRNPASGGLLRANAVQSKFRTNNAPKKTTIADRIRVEKIPPPKQTAVIRK